MAKKYTKIDTPQGQVILQAAQVAANREEGVNVVTEAKTKEVSEEYAMPVDEMNELAELKDKVSELEKHNEALQQQYLDALKQNADLEAGEDKKTPNTKVIITAVAAVLAILFLNN